jgi:DNA invertase Pin-like site-specific DNA recombinase
LNRQRRQQIKSGQISGKTTVRPELDACLKSLRKGDPLVVWRLDRLGRSLGDLIHLTTELRSRGVDFESLTEKIETGSSAGKLIFHVFASLAEFERNLIRERTLAGLKAARARGRNGGRPKKLKSKDIQNRPSIGHGLYYGALHLVAASGGFCRLPIVALPCRDRSRRRQHPKIQLRRDAVS